MLKFKNKNYSIGVSVYPSNNRLKLFYENELGVKDITLNIEEIYLSDEKVILDPLLERNGIIKLLKKKRIIKEICDTIDYNSLSIPIATLNMGVLRQYDNKGVEKFLKVKNEQ